MMSQANFFLQFKSVVNKSAELKIVTQPKSNFRLTWAPKVGLAPPPIGGFGGRLLRLCMLHSFPYMGKDSSRSAEVTLGEQVVLRLTEPY